MPYDPLEVFANTPSGTVTSGGTTAPAQGTIETWTVNVTAAFAATTAGTRQFHIADQALPSEPMTAISCPGGTGVQTWTVRRGAEGADTSTPVIHQAGFTVVQVITAGDLAALQFDPWQFPVEAYGAVGDGLVVTDGVMISGSHTLTCATSTPFLPTDPGKSILVSCAGGGTYSPLATTIATYVSPGVVTLTAAATSSTTTGSIVGYGTDNSAALNAAVAAAVAYAQANNGYAEVVFSNCNYALGGTTSPVNYKSALGNSLIPLPVISPSAEKILLVFCGQTKTLDQALMHWNQLVPQAASSVLMVLRTDGTNNGTYGPSSVIGSPIDGYGGDLGPFTNIMPTVDGLQILVPFNSTYGGFDFFGCAEAVVISGSVNVLGVVNYSAPAGAPQPNIYQNFANISNQWTWGLRMPCTGNNDRCDVYSWSCEGLCYGLGPSEHSYVVIARCIYCIGGIEFYSGNGVSMPHACRVAYASVEGSSFGMGAWDGQINVDFDTLDCESATPVIYDPSSKLIGYVGSRYSGGTPAYATPASIVNTGLQLKVVILDNAALVGIQTSGAPAAPATTVAQVNGYYRDAIVYAAATTSITAVKISAPSGTLTTVTGLTGAANVPVPIFVPAGRSYSVTFTGTLTTQWVLS